MWGYLKMAKSIALLLRHADYDQIPDTPSAHQPYGLNDKGRTQTKQAITLLEQIAQQYGAVFHPVIDSSSLLRSWQTAQIIMQGINGIERINTYDALTERSVGSAANLTIQQIETLLEQDSRFNAPPNDWKSNSDYCLPFPGAESLMMAGKRVADHLTQAMTELISAATAEETSNVIKLFIGHGAAFRHAAYHLGILQREQLVGLSMFHVQPVAFAVDQDGSWQHITGEWKVRNKTEQVMD